MASPVPPVADLHVTRSTVFVRGLRIDAEVGIYDAEHGRTQPLICDVDITFSPRRFEHIADTINYETVRTTAKAIAAEGHVKLVETFAERLAGALFHDVRVAQVRVRVEKPEALAPDAQAAGVELVVSRP